MEKKGAFWDCKKLFSGVMLRVRNYDGTHNVSFYKSKTLVFHNNKKKHHILMRVIK